MKRNFIITCVFIILSVVLLLTSCTCYLSDGTALRGCGHDCQEISQENVSCRRSCLDQLCPGEDIYQDYVDSISIVGEKSIDYEAPSISRKNDGNGDFITLSVNILNAYDDSPWNLAATVYAIQDGACVGKMDFSGKISYNGIYTADQYLSLNKFYDPQRGEIEYIINSFSLVREG
ncbi:MAG: hypothetical protein IKB23_02440 [Clostridia bacterium]|nr:hypothetical protein [Clostridia bacterium]